jgi:hypothetical protein
MKSTRTQCLRTLQKIAHVVARKAANSELEEWLEIKRDIETMRRIFVSMPDEVFQTQLKFYDEVYGSISMLRRKSPPIGILVAILIAGIAAFTTAQPNLRAHPVSNQLVTDFTNARCSFSSSESTKIDKFPAAYRTEVVASIYTEADGILPFQIYYFDSSLEQLFLVQNGRCRNISTLIPIPIPGTYFVRYFHDARPLLLRLDANTNDVKLDAWGLCELHETINQINKPKSNQP